MIGRTLLKRYLIESELGRGGMSTVYRAEDMILNRPVAIKVLTRSGLKDTEGRQRLLHEAQAVARLDHPNIVTVHDVFETDGTLYLVLQLVRGQTLKERQPDSLAGMIVVGLQIAEALEYAHSQGIIHRDIKPANVMVSTDGQAKLMDFGLAQSVSSQISGEGEITGTLVYISPEQILGQAIDGRSDLYSFGVMLYELTTGQPPFAADDPVSLLTQHLYAPAVPPRAKNQAISPRLNQLILGLLEKDPGKRPPSAAAVEEQLEQAQKAEAALDVPLESELGILTRIARGRMVGRGPELVEARSLWTKAVSDQGQTLLISGEPGIGKTRLVRELTTLAEVTGGRVLLGTCYQEGGSPYAPFGQIVKQVLGNGHNDLNLPNFVMAELLNLVPELYLEFPEIPINPALDPQAGQRRLFDSFASLIKALSRERPLLLVLEDAHWVDDGSASLLRHLARRKQNQAWLIVATYREIELDQDRPFMQVLMAVLREGQASRMKLSRLDRKNTKHLLQELFAAEITETFLEIIYRETEGNPFFIEEVCKSLVETGEITFDEGTWHRKSDKQLSIPQSVKLAIQSRLFGLDLTTQEVLQLAAVIGREFDFETLAAAGEWPEDLIISALEAAEGSQLIEEVSSKNLATYKFVHALIPNTLVESLGGLRRRRLHRRIAEIVEEGRPDETVLIAHHYRKAQESEKALHYLKLSGDRARQRFANEDAVRFYSQALEFAKWDEGRFGLLSSRIAVNHLMANRVAERADVDELVELADSIDDHKYRIDALLAQTNYFLERDHIRAHKPAKEAAEMARAIHDPVREALALRYLGTALWYGSNFGLSQEALERSAALYQESDQPGEAAASLHMLSLVMASLGDKDEALKAAEQALEQSRLAGNKVSEATSLRRVAIVHMISHQEEKALPFAEEALKLHQQLGDRSEEVNDLNAIGVIYNNMGENQAGQRCLEASLALAEEIEASVGIQFASFNMSIELLRQGQYQDSWNFATRNLDKYRFSTDRWLLGWLHYNQAIVTSMIGDLDLAISSFREALRLFEGIQSPSGNGEMISRMAALIADTGNYSEAKRWLDEASALVVDGDSEDSIAVYYLNLAYWHLLEGNDLGPGLDLVDKAISRFSAVDSVPNMAIAYYVQSMLLLALNHPEEALEAAEKLIPLLDTFETIFRPQRCWLAYYQALATLGEKDGAVKALQKALDWIQTVSLNLSDLHLRRCWLENIPANRLILKEAAYLGLIE